MIFSASVEEELPIADIMKRGHAMVKRDTGTDMLYIAEECPKRRRAAPRCQDHRRKLRSTPSPMLSDNCK